LSGFATYFLGYSTGYCYRCQSAGLSTAQHATAPPGHFESDFRQLSGFAATGLANYDYNLMVAKRCCDFLATSGNGQIRVTESRMVGGGCVGHGQLGLPILHGSVGQT